MNDLLDCLQTNSREFYAYKDNEYWKKIKQLVQDDSNLDIPFLLQNFMAFIQRRDLPRILAYYELFKMVKDLPGSIVELGVFYGHGLFAWGKLLETFCPNDRGRKAIGFDHYQGYGQDKNEYEEKSVEYIKGIRCHDMIACKETVDVLIKCSNLDNLIPGVERVRVIDGDISTTVPQFVSENMGIRISLLYLDVNLYKPTFTGLNYLYDLVVPGGIIALQGYGVPPWEGEAKALEDILRLKNIKVDKLKKFEFSSYPSAYFVKEI